MDSDFLEQKIDCWNKSPCLLNLNKSEDIVEKFNKFARVTYTDEPIILKILFSCPLKSACTLSNLKVEYDFYMLEET